ncbi:MAG: alpha/beta fold hydrolase [Janthinobacterium lividum]
MSLEPTMPNEFTRIVRRADVALHCQDEGAGPPVVFLASWSLPGASWHRQVAAFRAAGLRCVTYDRRGHGHTPDPGHGYDLDTLADDLAAVLDAFDLHGVTLVTFSAGSGEAVRYLTRHGTGRIARLAMIAPTTPLLVRRDDNPDGIDPALFEAFIQTELRPDWPGWLDRNARPFGGPDVAKVELDEVVAQALQASPAALECFYRALTSTDMRAELAQLRLPALVIQGEEDASSPPHLTGHLTASLVPGARLVLYEGAPHGLPVSHPARLNADLLSFIRMG